MLKKLFAKKEAPAIISPSRPVGVFGVEQERMGAGFDAVMSLNSKVFQRQAPAVSGMDSAYDINSIYGLQSATMPLNLASWYSSQSFIGYQLCAMIAQHWLVDKACTMPARDAARNGYELVANDGSDVPPDVLDYIRKRDTAMKLHHNLVEFIRMGRVFGIRLALFKVVSDDKDYYKKPFNIDGVKPGAYKGIAQIDPYWCAPLLDDPAASDPASIHFYEPTYWTINGQQIHRSHFVIFKGPDVADVLKPSYFYGGLSIPQRIYERVYAAERTANEAPQLSLAKRTIVLKTDIEKAMANQQQFESVLANIAYMQNNYGTRVIGDGDEYAQHDTSLADLDSVIMTQYQLVAAIAGVPATKLLGTSPKGFNATGEFEEASYHEELESIQENDMQKMLDRHYALLMRSEIVPKFQDFHIEVKWNPLDAPTAKEQAEVNFMKSQTAVNYAGVGAIDGEDIRAALIADPDSEFTAIEADAPVDDLDDDGENVRAESAEGGEAGGPSLQETMLNGAQINALIDVVNSVNSGIIPRESAIAILQKALQASAGEAKRLLGPPKPIKKDEANPPA